MTGKRAQSVVEYLTVHAWAIVIIVAVLAVLFAVGAFNPSNFVARVQAGSCQVYRPNGIGTSAFVSFDGTCTGGIPEYVAKFSGQAYITAGTTELPAKSSSKSVFAWVYLFPSSQQYPTVSYIAGAELNLVGTGSSPYYTYNVQLCMSACDSGAQVTTDKWVMIGYTYSSTSGTATIYLNGAGSSYSISPGNEVTYNCIGGADPCSSNELVGYLADVQIYNTSLSANEVKSLYQSGIGAVPENLQYISGWWPLNSNPYDYSGNGDNGTADMVTYTNSWLSGYSVP